MLSNADEVINKIEYYFENNFELEDEYIDRVDKIFNYKDKNNCKRLIDYLEEHEELP